MTNLIMMLLSASALASLIIAGTGEDNSDALTYVEGETSIVGGRILI
jgi:hypothetical protein